MIWPYLAALAAIVAALGWGRDDVAFRVGAVVLSAVLAIQLKKAALPDWSQYAGSAAIWAVAAVAVASVAIQRQFDYKLFAINALLTLIPLCYLWARVTGAPLRYGSASVPLIVSEVLIVVTLVIAGSGAAREFVARIGDVGISRGHSHGRSDLRMAVAKAPTQPEVSRHERPDS